MPRPHKGDRRFVATRLPADVADALADRADRHGLTLTDALHRAVVVWLDRTDEHKPQGVKVR